MSEENGLTPPVKEGDTIESQEVINVGKHNDGVVKYEGYVLFITGDMKIGDIISFKVDKILPKFGTGTKIEEGETE